MIKEQKQFENDCGIDTRVNIMLQALLIIDKNINMKTKYLNLINRNLS